MIRISHIDQKPDFAVAGMRRTAALEIFQQEQNQQPDWFAAATAAAAFLPSWLSFLAHCNWRKIQNIANLVL